MIMSGRPEWIPFDTAGPFGKLAVGSRGAPLFSDCPVIAYDSDVPVKARQSVDVFRHFGDIGATRQMRRGRK